jgi:hypothetical protein
MSVIKTLDASENNEEREREKLKIEKEFKKSDKKLQELVGKHDSELTKVSCWKLLPTEHNKRSPLPDNATLLQNLIRSRFLTR